MNNLINKVITDKINPVLKLHNGYCELVKVVDGDVYVKLLGGCVGCPSSKLTLYNGIAPILHDNVPGINSIILAE